MQAERVGVATQKRERLRLPVFAQIGKRRLLGGDDWRDRPGGERRSRLRQLHDGDAPLARKRHHALARKLCRRLRSRTTAPVLFLSARDTELDKVVGLEIGGDDYLAKPFGVRELIARVRALLRRGMGDYSAGNSNSIVAGGITLDEDAHTATGDKGEIELTPREFELLAALMKNAGKVVSREDLLHDAWGWEYLTETKTVDTHIKRLRDKISNAGYDPGLVETVRGYGYRFRQ